MDARGTPAAPEPGARWKRVGVGCLAVLGIGGILGMVAVGVWVKTRYPWIFEAGRAGQEAMQRARTSPVVEALNRSVCSESLVLAVDDITRLQGIVTKKASEKARPDFRWLVSCHVRDSAHPPGCDRVASAFHEAMFERGKFVVVVTAGLFRAPGKPVCRGVYDDDARPIRIAHHGAGATEE